MNESSLRPRRAIQCLAVLGFAAWMPAAFSDQSGHVASQVTATPAHAVGPVPGPKTDESRTAPQNPLEGNPDARQQGRRMFVGFNCAGCHGDHAGGGMGPSLRDEDWIYGGAPTQIYNSISDGRAHGMPAWGARLPPEVIWRLVSYIDSLRTADEPEPPQ